jgi:hypothetical protein
MRRAREDEFDQGRYIFSRDPIVNRRIYFGAADHWPAFESKNQCLTIKGQGQGFLSIGLRFHRIFARIFHALEMIIGKAAGVPLYACTASP